MSDCFDYGSIDEILAKHGTDHGAIIAILQEIQEKYNYLPKEIFPYLAEKMKFGEARIYGVATFYENFSLEPKGKYIIRCCDGTACHVRGSQPILNQLYEELGLSESKHTTDDLNFTAETVSCLCACGRAPVITVNGTVYPAMTQAKTSELIKELKEELKNG